MPPTLNNEVPLSEDFDERIPSYSEGPELVEGKDFYWDDKGRMVFVESYLLARGECCQSGCLHCPWS
jgi:hypothetical protein